MNPIERIVTALVNAMLGVVQALIGGIFRAPAEAARRAIRATTVRRSDVAAVIDLRHKVLREGRPRDTALFDGDEAADTRHWIAVDGERTVGVVTVIRRDFPDGDGPEWQLRGMAVDPDWRGRGVGQQMLVALEADVGEPLWCNARIGARDFYARNGWTPTGDIFEIPEVGPHVRMVRTPTFPARV